MVGGLLFFALSLFDRGTPINDGWTLEHGAKGSISFLVKEGMIPQEIYQRLATDTGIVVDETTFKDNEDLERIILSDAKFDIVLVPDYWVHQLERLEQIVVMDHEKVPNAKMASPKIREYHSIQPLLNSSLPYLFGTLSIGFNRYHFDDLPLSWSAFFDPELLKRMKGRVALNGEMRNMLSILLKIQGYSPNSTDPCEVKAAGEYLKQIMDTSLPYIGASGNDELLKEETVYIGVARSSEMAHAMEENPRMRFVNAVEGVVFFLECFAIMENCSDQDTAYALINYLCHPRVAARVTDLTYRASLNDAAKQFVRPEILNGPSYFFPQENHLILLKDFLPEEEEIYHQVWKDVMLHYNEKILPKVH